ncbi:MAG: hypothetical protein K0R79_2219 [Stenotrophomonas indicatrix]|nr:hypothetical protein [Stenotrophomonas indicatrix]
MPFLRSAHLFAEFSLIMVDYLIVLTLRCLSPVRPWAHSDSSWKAATVNWWMVEQFKRLWIVPSFC